VLEVAVQQQDLDQRPSACGVAERLACRGPERVVLIGEDAARAGLGECSGAGQRAGLAQQDLQIVVRSRTFTPLPIAR
jgi:hypothetical protein